MSFDARAKLFHRWTNPRDLIERHIGGPGYGLPDIGSFVWTQINSTSNWVVAPASGTDWQRNTFTLSPESENNIIVFSDGCRCVGRYYIMGSGNLAIVQGAEVGFQPVNVHFHPSDCVFFFGRHCTSNTTTFELGGAPSSIVVGEDCMFSAGIDVMTSDEHALIDWSSGSFLNPSESIHFEPHVWIGFQAVVLKGVRIGFGAVVGARAVVTRSVNPRTVVAGNPARVIREGVSWIRSRVPGPFAKNELHALEDSYKSTEF